MSHLLQIIGVVPPLLISVMLHEISHGLVAERLGDPTARRLGRITLNPLPHIDPVMTILFPAVLIFLGSPIIFGGAKPVPVNPLYFKNPRRGMAYVAIAGPLTNLCLATACYLLFNLLSLTERYLPVPGLVLGLLGLWLVFGILINLVLALFNLLPVPPLDGGRVAVGFLPLSLAQMWAKLERFGLLIVLALLLSGAVDKLLQPAIRLIEKLPILVH